MRKLILSYEEIIEIKNWLKKGSQSKDKCPFLVGCFPDICSWIVEQASSNPNIGNCPCPTIGHKRVRRIAGRLLEKQEEWKGGI